MIRFRVFLLLLAVIVSLGLFATVGARPNLPLPTTPVAPVIPTFISYQGRVTVGGALYDGTGYFQFAIVDSGGTSHWSSSTLTATVSNGYFSFAKLGSTSPITAGIFASSDRLMRVWFGTDGSTFEQLSPDTAIASVPYAQVAQQVEQVDWSGVQNKPATVTPQPTSTVVPTATPQPTPTIIPNIAYTNTSNFFTISQTVQSSAAASVALKVVGAASQSANLQEWWSYSANRVYITRYGGLVLSSWGISDNLLDVSGSTVRSDNAIRFEPVLYTNGSGARGMKFSPFLFPTAYLSSLYGDFYIPSINGVAGVYNYNVGEFSATYYRLDMASTYTATITNGIVLDVVGVNKLGGTLNNAYGLRVRDVAEGSSSNYSLYTNLGTVHLGDSVEVSGTVRPTITGTFDLGTSALAWHNVYANAFVTQSYGDFSDGVKLRDGRVVSCIDAISFLKRHPTEKTKNDLPHIDYSAPDFPAAAYVAPVSEIVTRVVHSNLPVQGSKSSVAIHEVDTDKFLYYESVVVEVLPGKPGADMDMIQSIMLCASKEMDYKLAVLEADVKALKERIKP